MAYLYPKRTDCEVCLLDKLDITAEGIRAVLGLEDASLEGGMLHLGAQTSVILK